MSDWYTAAPQRSFRPLFHLGDQRIELFLVFEKSILSRIALPPCEGGDYSDLLRSASVASTPALGGVG